MHHGDGSRRGPRYPFKFRVRGIGFTLTVSHCNLIRDRQELQWRSL
jgi:hypothetical protein